MTGAENPSHALALVVVDELVRSGVTDAVLAPGSRSTALAMALHDDSRIRLHVDIDERSAGFLAIGLARATGRPAAVVTTSGTATANLHPAVLEAHEGVVPVVLLTADRPPELRHRGANQTTDQVKLYGDAVRWFVEVGVPEDRPDSVPYWRATVSRAVAEAHGLSGRPGPVHLNLAFREPTVPAVDDGRVSAGQPFVTPLDGRPDGKPWTSVTAAARRLPDDEVRALARRLAGVERGVVVAGDSARPLTGVAELAVALGWPLVAEPTSGARHGEAVVAHATPLVAARGFIEAHEPELVLTAGRPTVSRAVLGLLASVPQLRIDGHGQWVDPTRNLAELVAADPEATVRDLLGQISPRGRSGWLQAWRDADRAAATAIADHLAGVSEVTEVQVARDVMQAVPANGVLVAASSMPIRDLDSWSAPRSDLRVVANRGLAGIDGFVSTALGVALAHDGPVVALAGDLSLLHDRNGFLLAPDGGSVDAVFVVVDNDGGGIFHFLPQASYPESFERVFGTPHGTDFAAVAASHGLGYHEARAPKAVGPTVAETITAGGTHLVHVRTDRGANVSAHRALQAAVDAAVRHG